MGQVHLPVLPRITLVSPSHQRMPEQGELNTDVLSIMVLQGRGQIPPLAAVCRMWTMISDIVLINGAFALAYVARYQWQWIRPIQIFVPYQEYLGQQLLLTLI